MAWIPVRTDLHEDPAVIGMAVAMGLDEFSVVGRLLRLWGWASHQTTTGVIPFVTLEKIDQMVQIPGFAAAMVKVGWLRCLDDSGVCIPNFDRWMDESAKKRLENTRRQSLSRKCRAKTMPPVLLCNVLEEGEEDQPEKRGEGVGEGGTVASPAPDAAEAKPERAKTVQQAESGFASFWTAWPNKVNERKARVAWFVLGPPDQPLVAEILAGVKRYAARKPPDQRWMNPETFLEGCRWRDEPAPVGRGPPGSGRVETPEQRLGRVSRENAEERKRSAEAMRTRAKFDVPAAQAAMKGASR